MLTFMSFLNDNLGKSIFIPGYNTAECVAPFWRFNNEHKGEKYSANGASNLWTNYTKWDSYDRITGTLVYGDWLIWSGNSGAYPNGGNGHIAMYLRDSRPGYAIFASQNPGAFREMELSLSGALGALRAKGVSKGGNIVNRALSGAAYVRTGASVVHSLAPGYPTALPKGTLIACIGKVKGLPPWKGASPVWVKTVSGFYVHSSNVGNADSLPNA